MWLLQQQVRRQPAFSLFLSHSACSDSIWQSSLSELKYQNKPPCTVSWLFCGFIWSEQRVLQVHSTWFIKVSFGPHKSTVKSTQCTVVYFDILLKMLLQSTSTWLLILAVQMEFCLLPHLFIQAHKGSFRVGCEADVIIAIIDGCVCFDNVS